MLTPGQIAHFETFGFLVLRQLFTPEEAAIMKRESIEIFDEVRGSKPFTGEKWEQVQPFFERRPFSAMLVDDDRVYNIGVDLLGPDFFLIGTEGSLHVGDTPWHGGPPPENAVRHVKIAFYLDPLTRDTGAVRVVPGSHMCGDAFADRLEDEIRDGAETWSVAPDQVPAVVVETVPGDVVVFWHNTKHAAFGGSKRRRMFTMNFYEYVPDDRLVDFQNALANEGRFWIDRIHGEAMLRTAGPERMVHLRQVIDNDFKVAEVHARLRQERSEPSRG